jgi:hypothetical protein
MTARPRSAGVTAAATLALLGCGAAFFFWAYFLLTLLNLPADTNGKHLYQVFPIAFLVIALVPPAVIAVGIRTGIGLFHLRPWARVSAMVWAAITLALCLGLIAFRPFETFFISDRFVGQLESLKQLVAIAFVILLFPVSVWWLFLFRTKGVKLQFQAANMENQDQQAALASEV